MPRVPKVTLKDGRFLSGRAEFAKWPKEKTEAAIKFVKILESAPDMRTPSALLTS